MADDRKSDPSERKPSYRELVSAIIGERMAAKFTEPPPEVIAKDATVTFSDNNKSLAEEITEEVQDCIDEANIIYFSEYRQNIDNDKIIPGHLGLEIKKLVADINAVDTAAETAQNLDRLLLDASMGKFADRFGKKQNESEPPAPLSEAAATSSSEKFRIFLEKEGIQKSEANRIAALHTRFVQTELPELSMLAAVQELRNQFKPTPVKPKTPYPGKRIYPDARKFLRENYGDEIDNGQMTPGKLQELDKSLYMALYREVDGAGETVADLVSPQGKPYAKRVIACATILGTSSPEEAGRFFSGLRVDRIAKHERVKAAL